MMERRGMEKLEDEQDIWDLTHREALENFLEGWQNALIHMATPHANLTRAAEELKDLRLHFNLHLKELESLAAAVDSADGQETSAASEELIGKRDALKEELKEKQATLKQVIDKLRHLQSDLTVLTCATAVQE
ncbi:hypothetical protein GUITHDRAFT_121119 [Guillardia theta CCMP2712]|uniref:Uncharacterized protein n=1 Tax=Guillardia theta (strain CCMP2712) TaxID=905079 RepID=L1IA48_GUITC|nr:hypothetical protein GUITHDRAFT_121119 [Guillardia theta CCMP2712]EKX32720.1 hypothetical protein GUITHDRAFT_121119 [Guillardia theta CCMP2712]|eukprot:XP_005819700.1 hypothetical protein GUITHDRAFT_121119 [Guillardia theta CCMP2712]